ncbi:MAG: TRAM domain-containing protein, partial [Planctomycetota bacterium]
NRHVRRGKVGGRVRFVDAHINADLAAANMPVDQRLLELARQLEAKAITIDFNLNRVSQVTDVPVLNLHDLASSLQLKVMPGDTLRVPVDRLGKGEDQGIGYLEDGTMVVIEEAGSSVGQTIEAIVTNTTQTSAGRMVFARLVGKPEDAAGDEPGKPHNSVSDAPLAVDAKPERRRRKRIGVAAGEEQSSRP